jgi:hypothetical protein
MHVLILGTGTVGTTLGKRFGATGHHVTYISRSPDSEKVTALLGDHPGEADAAPYEDIPAEADAVLVALPYGAALDVLEPVAGDLAGLTLLDATNPFNSDGTYGVPGSSAAQQIAEVVPGAAVVKAFNTIGTDVMANPAFREQNADLFICGDSPDAKSVASTLAEGIGFNVIDVGELTMASYLEAMTVVWIAVARGGGSRNVAWKMLRR